MTKPRTKKSNEEKLSATTKNDLDANIKYINRMTEEIQDAETTPNDIEPLRRLIASDFVIIPDGGKPLGAAQVKDSSNFMEEMWKAYDVKMEYHSESVKIVGDIAIDRGWAKDTLRNKKTGEITTHWGNYLWISQRDKDGVWKQTHVIWNKRSE